MWGKETNEEEESTNDHLPAFLTNTRFYFEKLHVESFQVVVTCNPANALPEELQSLKTALEIPVGFPPVMENANVEFGKYKCNCKTVHRMYLNLEQSSRQPHVFSWSFASRADYACGI